MSMYYFMLFVNKDCLLEPCNLIYFTFYYRLINESKLEVEDVEKRIRPITKYKKLPIALKSPFWTKYDGQIKNVSVKEKIISEFAFTSESDQEDISISNLNNAYIAMLGEVLNVRSKRQPITVAEAI